MRAFVVVCCLAALAGCSAPELAPPAQPQFHVPELSETRGPRRTADPPPPIREERQRIGGPAPDAGPQETTVSTPIGPPTGAGAPSR